MSRLCISRIKIRHYGESIIIQSQQGHGRSNIVFSSSVSIGDAINTASQLKSDLKVAQITLQMAKQAHTDDQFLHTAANIIQKATYTSTFFLQTFPFEYSLQRKTSHLIRATNKLC
jgi:hypothetical protein